MWWFGLSAEQYRVAGDLELIGDSHPSAELLAARRGMWAALSDLAREQFFWPGPPGAPTTEVSQVAAGIAPVPPPPALPPGGRDEAGAVLPAPPTFLLVLLWPKQVKYLRLTDNFAQRDRLLTGGWDRTQVNP